MASIPPTWHVLMTMRSRPVAQLPSNIKNSRGRGSMRLVSTICRVGALVALACPVAAPAAEMRGVTATEIKIGQTMPYSGPVSAFGALGKGELAYFKMLKEHGGINGPKINL